MSKEFLKELDWVDILSNAPLPIFFLDNASNIKYANNKWWEYVGFETYEDPNTWLHSLSVESRVVVANAWQELTSGKKIYIDIEVTFEKSKNTAIMFAYKSNNYYLAYLFEVSNYKNSLTRGLPTLRRQLEWNEKIRRQQSMYIQLLTYHIRQSGFQGNIPEDRMDFLRNTLRDICNRITEFEKSTNEFSTQFEHEQLLNDISHVSNLDLEQIQLQNKSFQLKVIFENVTSKLKIKNSIPNDTIVIGDKHRLQNLITYIIRFVETLYIMDGDDDNGNGNGVPFIDASYDKTVQNFIVQVKFTGNVLAEVQRNFLESPLNELTVTSISLDNDINVTLCMMKALVEVFDGCIQFSSHDGQNILWVTIGLKESSQKVSTSKIGKRLNVLITEDNTLVQKVFQQQLEKIGHTAYCASDGKMALEIFENQSIDIIFMDIEIPYITGIEATRRIREKEQGTGRHVPIIAVTGFKDKDYENKAFESGANAFITKPFTIDDLVRIIDKYIVT